MISQSYIKFLQDIARDPELREELVELSLERRDRDD